MIRVLIADDQALVRDGFRSILERDVTVEVVGEAANGLETLELIDRTAPDVVLLDLDMPLMGGLEALPRLLDRPEPPRVLVLTTYDTDENLHGALRLGASGFLLKDIRAAQLVEAVHTVARGEALVSPQLVHRIVRAYTARRPEAPARPQRLDVLSRREMDVMRLMSQALSNAEIARELFLSEATVKTHVNRILTKLGLRDRVQVVVLAYEEGLAVPRQ